LKPLAKTVSEIPGDSDVALRVAIVVCGYFTEIEFLASLGTSETTIRPQYGGKIEIDCI